MQLERHPLSKLWPDIPESQFEELKADIEKHGQRYPIIIYGDKIIDGWHRYRACMDVRIKPKTERFSGTAQAAADLVNSLNAHRRNVSDGVRAFAVTGAYTWAEGSTNGGGVSRDTPPDTKTNREMAALAGTSESTIHRAKRVHESGSSALKEAVRSGDVSVKQAAKVVDLPKSEQLAAAKAKPKKEPEPSLDSREPEEDEGAQLEQAEKEYTASIDKVMAADDKLAAAHAEIKRQAAEIASLKLSRNGFQNKCDELIRRIKGLQRQNDKLKPNGQHGLRAN